MLLLASRRCRYLSLLSSLLFDRTLYSQASRTLADEIRRWFVVGTNKHCVSAWASLVVMLKGLAVKSVAALAQKKTVPGRRTKRLGGRQQCAVHDAGCLG